MLRFLKLSCAPTIDHRALTFPRCLFLCIVLVSVAAQAW